MSRDRIESERLNRRIAILRNGTASDDGFGTTAGALQRLCWRYASVKPVMRRESTEAVQERAAAELSAWLRFDDVTRTIKATDRVAVDGKLFELTGTPVEVGFREGIELLLVSSPGNETVDADALSPWP